MQTETPNVSIREAYIDALKPIGIDKSLRSLLEASKGEHISPPAFPIFRENFSQAMRMLAYDQGAKQLDDDNKIKYTTTDYSLFKPEDYLFAQLTHLRLENLRVAGGEAFKIMTIIPKPVAPDEDPLITGDIDAIVITAGRRETDSPDCRYVITKQGITKLVQNPNEQTITTDKMALSQLYTEMSVLTTQFAPK